MIAREAPTPGAAAGDTSGEWDDFLASCPRGQFQQSCGWAQAKALEGWASVREYLDPRNPASGGVQLLWKRRGVVRVGYVSKGPVLSDETEATVSAALGRVTESARRLGLSAVVVQPPDDSTISSRDLVRAGCFEQPVRSVTATTGIVDLADGAEAVLRGMSAKARQQWRRAGREGVALAWGGRGDLPEFFRLMCESCRRQRQEPNPRSPAVLDAMWRAFPNRLHLAFAEHRGQRRAGLLLIAERRRVIFWKKGWDAEGTRAHVNHYLMAECLLWASAHGFEAADVLSMSPEIAAALLNAGTLSEVERHSRDAFNLRFGARPKRLPFAHLLIPGPFLHHLAHAGLRWKALRAAVERRIG